MLLFLFCVDFLSLGFMNFVFFCVISMFIKLGPWWTYLAQFGWIFAVSKKFGYIVRHWGAFPPELCHHSSQHILARIYLPPEHILMVDYPKIININLYNIQFYEALQFVIVLVGIFLQPQLFISLTMFRLKLVCCNNFEKVQFGKNRKLIRDLGTSNS